MSLQLKVDEMLDVMQAIDPAKAAPLVRAIEGIADALALGICAHFDVTADAASFQGTAFAGTCVPFHPKYKGQDCPPELAEFDDGGVEDWDADAESADLREAAEGDRCTACGRDSYECSRNPCPDVIADRGDDE